MNRPNRDVLQEWHVAINQYHYGDNFKRINEYQHFLYDAKNMSDEIPRMSILFKAERLGELPKIHRQCSHSEPEQVIDNHLSCCLGVKCKECPFLLALEGANVSRENVDEIKAWTCAAHILSEKSKRMIDDGEGYILTVDDKMYWQNVYRSLSRSDDEEE